MVAWRYGISYHYKVNRNTMANDTRRFGALSSSTDPEQIGNTVKGIVLGLSSLILIVAPETDVTTLASQIGLAASGLWVAYGLVMKIVVWAQKRLSV